MINSKKVGLIKDVNNFVFFVASCDHKSFTSVFDNGENPDPVCLLHYLNIHHDHDNYKELSYVVDTTLEM